jgi:6-phosphofructokinase 1
MAYYVEQELARRKKAGKYKGGFAPVTHYFGYQGRCSHPSDFDCSLGSTYGFTAGVLIDNGLTGMATTAQQISGPVARWRVGGVPLLSLLRSQPKAGYARAALVVPSEEVDLNGEIYQKMKTVERSWRYVDHYSNPGPIQLFGYGKGELDISLQTLYEGRTRITEELRSLCRSITNDSMYIEHSHLLLAGLSALESARTVLNSLSNQSRLGASSLLQ